VLQPSLPAVSLREIADPTKQGSAPARESAAAHWQGVFAPRRDIVATSYIFDEVVRFFNRRGHHQKAAQVGNALLHSPAADGPTQNRAPVVIPAKVGIHCTGNGSPPSRGRRWFSMGKTVSRGLFPNSNSTKNRRVPTAGTRGYRVSNYSVKYCPLPLSLERQDNNMTVSRTVRFAPPEVQSEQTRNVYENKRRCKSPQGASDGRVEILDFGLAKLLGSDADAGAAGSARTATLQTLPGAVMGTVGSRSLFIRPKTSR